MAKAIKRVAVLGAGVMGSGIAAHLANAGIESVLFDMVPRDAGDDPKSRNALAINAIEALKKSKPAQLYLSQRRGKITPANYDDHGDLLGTCDWIVEVVVERLDIKQHVFQWVADNRAEGSVVSSNTSGISLAAMAEGMSEEMRAHFLVTHFFNPVRYMRLFEIVAGAHTHPAIVEKMANFGRDVLGKGVVFAKDTPNFVANRVGTFGMGSVFRHMATSGLSVEVIDGIFGAAMGRPKSAVFRTADVVGLDTLAHVFATVYDNCPDDEERDAFIVPDYLKGLIADGRLGSKTKAGFYKKVKVNGKSEILSLNVETLEYTPQEKVRFASTGAARKAGSLAKKLKALCYGDDKAAEVAWAVTADTLIYSANRIPEIADDVNSVDCGMRWGFGWEMGPFQTWDAIGVQTAVDKMEGEGRTVPAWVKEMLTAGRDSFYQRDESGNLTQWVNGQSVILERAKKHLFLADVKAKKTPVLRSVSADLHDLGDGVLGLEFHSKLNSLDDEIFKVYANALDRLDNDEFDSLVVGNQDGKAFCAGANVMMILMGAMQGEWKQLEGTLKSLQALLMRAKYFTKPIVTAPYALTLGGGAEVAMHSSATVANGELYMGLVEAGVGLIPGAGGCKELIMRALGDVPQDIAYDANPFVQKVFQRIGMANVSSSALEAKSWGFLRPTDKIVLDYDALLGEAKAMAIGLTASGYVPPSKRTVKLPGRSGKAAIELFLYQMQEGGMASAHDVVVGKALAHVLTGGDIPNGTRVTEWDLLDLERESFLSLAGTSKSQARMQHMLQKGKPLRN